MCAIDLVLLENAERVCCLLRITSLWTMLDSKLSWDSKILRLPAGEGLQGVTNQPEILTNDMWTVGSVLKQSLHWFPLPSQALSSHLNPMLEDLLIFRCNIATFSPRQPSFWWLLPSVHREHSYKRQYVSTNFVLLRLVTQI